MPVKIPDGLPAAQVLEHERVFVMPESRAFAQDIRPLQIVIVNVMPMKSATETQLLRLLSNSPLQVAVTFLHPQTHTSKNTHQEHLDRFYTTFDRIRDSRFDCLIITGAPVETLPFVDVAYWKELQEIMEWSRTHVHASLYICWGAQAGLYHHFGVRKCRLRHKLSGVFKHHLSAPRSPLLQGFDDMFWVPHSRHTTICHEDLDGVEDLEVLSESPEAGVYLVASKDFRHVFVTGHPEYDQFSLREEYVRDIAKGLRPRVPVGYFPDDNPELTPSVRWRSHASLLVTNWLNTVYQTAPFDLNSMGARA